MSDADIKKIREQIDQAYKANVDYRDNAWKHGGIGHQAAVNRVEASKEAFAALDRVEAEIARLAEWPDVER